MFQEAIVNDFLPDKIRDIVCVIFLDDFKQGFLMQGSRDRHTFQVVKVRHLIWIRIIYYRWCYPSFSVDTALKLRLHLHLAFALPEVKDWVTWPAHVFCGPSATTTLLQGDYLREIQITEGPNPERRLHLLWHSDWIVGLVRSLDCSEGLLASGNEHSSKLVF